MNEQVEQVEPEEQPQAEAAAPRSMAAKKLHERMQRDANMLKEREWKKERDSKLERAENVLTTIRTNPLDALQSAGVELEELKNLLADHDDDHAVSIQDEINYLKTEIERRNARETQEKESLETDEILSTLRDYVTENSDSYPGLNAAGGTENLIYQRIEAAYKRDGTILSEEDAATSVEEELYELFSRLAPVYGSDERRLEATKPQTQTLTNSLAAERSDSRGGFNPTETEAEKLERRKRLVRDMWAANKG